MRVKFDGNEIDFDQSHDINLMDYIFKIIDENYNAKIIKKINVLGADQAYWDIKINNLKFTLHYEHYLGVSLCMYKPQVLFSSTKIKAVELLNDIYMIVKNDKLYI